MLQNVFTNSRKNAIYNLNTTNCLRWENDRFFRISWNFIVTNSQSSYLHNIMRLMRRKITVTEDKKVEKMKINTVWWVFNCHISRSNSGTLNDILWKTNMLASYRRQSVRLSILINYSAERLVIIPIVFFPKKTTNNA